MHLCCEAEGNYYYNVLYNNVHHYWCSESLLCDFIPFVYFN